VAEVTVTEKSQIAVDTDSMVRWNYYKKTFVAPSGRVIDFKQNGISHSEGQGYTMLLAVRFNDEPLFNLVWRWTERNLMVRKSDALAAWSWGTRVTGEKSVIDFNNATDGDLSIAWALFKAGEKWHRPEYIDKAFDIVRSIRRHLVVEENDILFLLPGYYGFASEKAIKVNLSYLMLSAFKEFSLYRDSRFWKRLYESSVRIIGMASHNGKGLPPDWVSCSGTECGAPEGNRYVFGYEAIRVLLYLAWEKRLDVLPGLSSMLDIMDKEAKVPAVISLDKKETESNEASGGMIAVWARVAAVAGRDSLAERLWQMAGQKIVMEKKDYYSYVLYLFSLMGLR
jgi:endoglucanase